MRHTLPAEKRHCLYTASMNNMIYTAMPRAIEMLHMFMPENVSEGPIGDLKKILKGRDAEKDGRH